MNSSIFRRLVAVFLVLVLAIPASAFDKYGGGPIVAELAGRLLEQTHYARRPIDDTVSKEFLHNYLDAYDYNHMIFEKNDVALTARRRRRTKRSACSGWRTMPTTSGVSPSKVGEISLLLPTASFMGAG